jgi:hypothetical protein
MNPKVEMTTGLKILTLILFGLSFATTRFWSLIAESGEFVEADSISAIVVATLTLVAGTALFFFHIHASYVVSIWYALSVTSFTVPVFAIAGVRLTLPTVFVASTLGVMLPLAFQFELLHFRIVRKLAGGLICAAIIVPAPTNPFRYVASISIASLLFFSPALELLRRKEGVRVDAVVKKMEHEGRAQLALLHRTIPSMFIDLLIRGQRTTSVSSVSPF